MNLDAIRAWARDASTASLQAMRERAVAFRDRPLVIVLNAELRSRRFRR